MRFVCLLVEHLPTRVETLLNPDLASKPSVILRGWDERVLDASPDVIAVGVGVGDSRRRVEQLCPQAIIIPAHEETYQSQHDALRSMLLSFQPKQLFHQKILESLSKKYAPNPNMTAPEILLISMSFLSSSFRMKSPEIDVRIPHHNTEPRNTPIIKNPTYK